MGKLDGHTAIVTGAEQRPLRFEVRICRGHGARRVSQSQSVGPIGRVAARFALVDSAWRSGQGGNRRVDPAPGKATDG